MITDNEKTWCCQHQASEVNTLNEALENAFILAYDSSAFGHIQLNACEHCGVIISLSNHTSALYRLEHYERPGYVCRSCAWGRGQR